MKNNQLMLLIIIMLLALIISCPNKEQSSPEGYGIVRISLSLAGANTQSVMARTAMPSFTEDDYNLKFYFNGKEAAHNDQDENGYTFTLYAGSYNIKAEAYWKDDDETPVAKGEDYIFINEGENERINIDLTPVDEILNGEGTLKFVINYKKENDDDNADDISVYSFTLKVIFKEEDVDIFDELEEVNINEDNTFEEIPAGFYTMNIILQKESSKSYASKSKVVHIYNDKVTPLELTFKRSDFISNVVVNNKDNSSNEGQIPGSLRDVIQNADDGAVIRFMLPPEDRVIKFADYTINITKNIVIQVNDDITFKRGNNFTVPFFEIKNNSLTLTTTENGSLTIDGIYYDEKNDLTSTAPIIKVTKGGTFIMDGNVTLTGNNTSETNNGGGAVSVNGEFFMYSGEISGNRAKSGGGVCLYEGTFIMSGGSIIENTAYGDTIVEDDDQTTPNDGGGGVYLFRSAIFKKFGGIISGNEAVSNLGHQVFVQGGDIEYIAHQNNMERNEPSYENDDLDSEIEGEAGGWEYVLRPN